MDDDAPSTSRNPDFQRPPSPPYISTQPFRPPPPFNIIPNFPQTPSSLPPIFNIYYIQPPPPTIQTYPPTLFPHQYYSLPPPPQFLNPHLVAPPPLQPQWPQFQSHYSEQQPPQEEWADSRSIQDTTNFVSVGPRISSRRNKNVHRPENYYHGNPSSSSSAPAPRIPEDQQGTTIVIKNIPNDYTRETLLQFLDDHCKKENESHSNKDNEESAYDFVYLAMDYNNGENKGFAFVNFTNPKAAGKFIEAFRWKPWPGSMPLRIINVQSSNTYQGKEANVAFHENRIYRCDKDEYLPLMLYPPSNGSGAQGNRYLVGKRVPK